MAGATHPRRPSLPSLSSPKTYTMVLSAPVLAVLALFLCQLSRGALQHIHDTPGASGPAAPLLLDATLLDLSKGLAAGTFTSQQLVATYIKRINEVNNTLHVVTELNPDASAIAQLLDKERVLGHVRGPLHGIPVLIKNNIGTADSLNNTAGSFALLGTSLPADAPVITKLRNAGAIILGKSNMSQWAFFRTTNTINGYAAYGGQATGTYYTNQDPCGSSSGSGVGTSLGLSWAALGTETDGSLICPGANNNIVSIKPTVGLTSRYLVIPISATQDTVGPMARTVEDAATLLRIIAGPCPYDNATWTSPFGTNVPDYVAAARQGTLKGKRLGVPRNWISFFAADNSSAPLLAAFEASLQVLRDGGASVVDSNFTFINDPTNFAVLQSNEQIILETEFIDGLATYLKLLTRNPRNLTSLADVREFTQHFPAEGYPDIDTNIWDDALSRNVGADSAPVYEARQQNFALGATGGIEASIKRDGLDAVVLPSLYAPSPAAVVGSPLITVPMGAYPNGTDVALDPTKGLLVERAPGIPFGLAFAGLKWSEEQLIGLAAAYEQATHWRGKVHPVIVPTSEL